MKTTVVIWYAEKRVKVVTGIKGCGFHEGMNPKG